jgi:hypothetical protein
MHFTIHAAALATMGIALGSVASAAAPPSTQPTPAKVSGAYEVKQGILLHFDGDALPATIARAREAARIIVPRSPDGMPRAPVYVTQREQWIPRAFNGGTFYIIPCQTGDKGASVAPTTTGTIAVPTAQPSPR